MSLRPLRCLLLLTLATTGLGLARPPANAPDFTARLVIAGATVIDVADGTEQAGLMLVIEGDRIRAMVPDSEFTPQSGDQVVEASGHYVIPGLWDMHFHITIEEELAPRMFALALAHGITGVRDVGGRLEKVLHWRERSRAAPQSSPRVAVAGPLIDGFPTVYDGSAPHRPLFSITVRNAEEARATADRLAEAGVDFLKTYEMLSAEAFRALLDRAAHHGLRVAGHVPFSVGADEASDLGIGSMEHFRNVEMAGSAEAAALLQQRRRMLAEGRHLPGGDLRSSIHRAQRPRALAERDAEVTARLLDRFARNRTAQVPTLVIMAGSRVRMDADPAWKELLTNMPDSMREDWEGTAQRLAGMSEADWEAHHAYADWLLETTRAAYEAGVPILAGSDTPVPLALPGHSLHEELRALVLAGLPEEAALQAATLEAARWLGLEAEIGTVTAGKIADLVILSANPLQDIANTRLIQGVVRAGRYYDRTDLDAMLVSGDVPVLPVSR